MRRRSRIYGRGADRSSGDWAQWRPRGRWRSSCQGAPGRRGRREPRTRRERAHERHVEPRVERSHVAENRRSAAPGRSDGAASAKRRASTPFPTRATRWEPPCRARDSSGPDVTTTRSASRRPPGRYEPRRHRSEVERCVDHVVDHAIRMPRAKRGIGHEILHQSQPLRAGPEEPAQRSDPRPLERGERRGRDARAAQPVREPPHSKRACVERQERKRDALNPVRDRRWPERSFMSERPGLHEEDARALGESRGELLRALPGAGPRVSLSR